MFENLPLGLSILALILDLGILSRRDLIYVGPNLIIEYVCILLNIIFFL